MQLFPERGILQNPEAATAVCVCWGEGELSQWLASLGDPRRLLEHQLRTALNSTSWKSFPRVKTRIEHGAHAKDPMLNLQRTDTVGSPCHPRLGFSRNFPAIGQGAENSQVLLEATGLLDPQC